MKFLLLLIFFIPKAYSVECQWWQKKWKDHTVSKYPKKDGSQVRSHPRDGHCRDKWPKASFYIERLNNIPPPYWSKPDEKFKTWNIQEAEIILEILPKLPPYIEIDNYYFFRAETHKEFKKNPAEIDVKTRSVVLYDIAFKNFYLPSVIVHESAHYLFEKLDHKVIEKFSDLSGWKTELVNNKLIKTPPKSLIIPDSKDSVSEDFSNHLELYFSSPDVLKRKNLNLFLFFEERYK